MDNSENNKENILGQEQEVEAINEPNAWPNRKDPPLSNAPSSTTPVHMHRSGPINSQTKVAQPAKEPEACLLLMSHYGNRLL